MELPWNVLDSLSLWMPGTGVKLPPEQEKLQLHLVQTHRTVTVHSFRKEGSPKSLGSLFSSPWSA